MQQEIQRRKGTPGPMNSRPVPACDGAGAQSSAGSDLQESRDGRKIRVLVTGADGFVGRHLVPYLVAQGYSVVAASRAVTAFDNPDVTAVPLSDLSRLFDWQAAARPVRRRRSSCRHCPQIRRRRFL
jgi:hypothetical protein